MEASGTCSDSEAVGPGYVEEVTLPAAICPQATGVYPSHFRALVEKGLAVVRF